MGIFDKRVDFYYLFTANGVNTDRNLGYCDSISDAITVIKEKFASELPGAICLYKAIFNKKNKLVHAERYDFTINEKRNVLEDEMWQELGRNKIIV